MLFEALVNIGPVVTGCPCEEGPSCTDQVWILATHEDKTVGLQLSKAAGHWGIGLIQKWWLEAEDLSLRKASFHPERRYFEAWEALEERFPKCAQTASDTAGIRQH